MPAALLPSCQVRANLQQRMDRFGLLRTYADEWRLPEGVVLERPPHGQRPRVTADSSHALLLCEHRQELQHVLDQRWRKAGRGVPPARDHQIKRRDYDVEFERARPNGARRCHRWYREWW